MLVPGTNLPGAAAVRECRLAAAPTLVVCGHCYWQSPLQQLSNGTQVCNVDSRVVAFERAR